MAQNVAAIFFEPVFRSYGGEGPVEALRLSNEELKRQLAPQGGRTQVIFSMFVLSKNTHQNGPNKFLLWAFRSFEYLLVSVWVWGSPCCYAARCENLAHDLRNLWVRNQALPEIRNEIRKSKTWTNTKKSVVQDAQKCDAMRWTCWTTCWPFSKLIRSVNRGCDMLWYGLWERTWWRPWLKWRLQLLPKFVRRGYVCRSWQEPEEALSSHKAPEMSIAIACTLTLVDPNN